MTAPVDHDLLADYVGGALAGTPEAEHVATLIATSPAWRTAAEQLTHALNAVSQDLQTLSGYPESMPDDIADRFEEFLASPVLLSKPAQPIDPLAERSVPRSSSPRPRLRGLGKWAVPVAALAVAAGGFFVFRSLPLSVSPTAGGGTAADSSLHQRGEAAAVPAPIASTGQNYGRPRAASSPVAPAVEPTFGDGPVITPFRSGAEATLDMPDSEKNGRLQACLDAVMKALPGVITLVDYAKFEGRPALVISITSSGQPWMFVAGPSCGINGPDEIFRAPLK